MNHPSNPVATAETRLTNHLSELVWCAQFVRTEVSHLAIHGTCFEHPLAVRVRQFCTQTGKALAWLERFCVLAGLKSNLWQQVGAAYRRERDSLPPLPQEYKKEAPQ